MEGYEALFGAEGELKSKAFVKSLFFVGTIFLVLINPVGGRAEGLSNKRPHVIEGGARDEIINLRCYEKDLKRTLDMKVDLASEKVLQPDYIKWGRVIAFKNSDEIRLVLHISDGNESKFLSIYGADGRMNVCKYDYESQSCETFQCYRSDVPLFKVSK